MSIDVRTARRADWSIHRPETPTPVPISMIDSALIAAVTTANCAPMAGETGSTPSSWETCRARAIPSDSMTWLSTNFQFSSWSDTCTPRWRGCLPSLTGGQSVASAVYPVFRASRVVCGRCLLAGTRCDAHRRDASPPSTCAINYERNGDLVVMFQAAILDRYAGAVAQTP